MTPSCPPATSGEGWRRDRASWPQKRPQKTKRPEVPGPVWAPTLGPIVYCTNALEISDVPMATRNPAGADGVQLSAYSAVASAAAHAQHEISKLAVPESTIRTGTSTIWAASLAEFSVRLIASVMRTDRISVQPRSISR